MTAPEPRLASSWVLLPPELLDNVLDHVDPELIQTTAAALLRVLPRCGLSEYHLWRHMVIRSQQQAKELTARLGPLHVDAETKQDSVRSCALIDWLPDDYIASNLIASFRNVRRLSLRIGPRWQPEALEEALKTPFMHLKQLDLRFNLSSPVKNFYSFHAGMYFDGVLDRALCSWPEMRCFQSFSFVQDLPPFPPPEELEELTLEMGRLNSKPATDSYFFAQPLVLFRHSFAIATLASSEIATHLRHLRLRLPSRSVLVPLSHPQTSTTVLPTTNFRAFPHLELLDISTTFVLPEALRACLMHHINLKHLIIDRSNLLDVEDPSAAVQSLGKTLAMLPLARATTISRVFRNLQTARESNARRRGGQPDRPSDLATLPSRLILVPSAPTTLSFSLGADHVHHADLQPAFHKGWGIGLASLKEALDERAGQLRRSRSKGEDYRLARVRPPGCPRPMYQAGNGYDEFCARFDLVPCTVEDLEGQYLALQEATCIFCTVPDCCGQGGIVVGFPDPSSWNVTDGGLQTSTDQHPAFANADELDRSGWRRPAAEHTPGCGHLVARQVWAD